MGRYLLQITIQASGNPNIAQANSDEPRVALPRHLVLGMVALLVLMAAGCAADESATSATKRPSRRCTPPPTNRRVA